MTGCTLGESLASRLETICAIPSPVGSEQALCDEVEKWAHARFPKAYRVKNSLVVFADGECPASSGSGSRPLVVLCGHLDTIPVHAADQGKPPRREGTRLIAPGASDMKSGVAVAMELAERLPAAERFCDLALVFYSREEGPYDENELGDLFREVKGIEGAGLAICLEPTDNVLHLGCMGSIQATLTFTGKAAHSARPWQGENAIYKAAGFLVALASRPERAASSGGLLYREVMSATRIEAGRARNVVPDRCTINVNFRFAPDKSLEAAIEEVRAFGHLHGAAVEPVDRSPACPAQADHTLVERFRERTGVATEPKQAWTDVARFAAAGIPAVNFGPGTTTQSHQQGEWADLLEIEKGYGLVERFLRK
jgi:succinyl-diaminopimelate desuccinylase